MNERLCRSCGAPIPLQYTGRLCAGCLIDAVESKSGTNATHYTIKDMTDLLGYTSEEYVRRLSREGKIPGRVPGTKRHIFFQSIINQWLKQNQTLPGIPASPLQEEAKERCDHNDHDWLYDETFDGVAYRTYDDVTQGWEEVLKVGYRKRRSCFFCGYSITISNLANY